MQIALPPGMIVTKSNVVALALLEVFLNLGGLIREARALEVNRTSSGGLELSGDSCDEISRQIPQLEKWIGSSSGSQQCSASSRITKTTTGCSAEITDCVPQHVLEYHGVHPTRKGPNCFNLVMVNKGLMPALLKGTDAEMNYYLRSSACRKLTKNDSKQAGDVGLISSGLGLYHGFIHVTDQLVYTKNGETQVNPYELATLKSVSDAFDVGKAENAIKESECYGSREAHCRTTVRIDYYRCKPMEEILRDSPQSALKEKVVQATQLFDQITHQVSRTYFEAHADTSSIETEIQAKSDALSSYLTTELASELRSSGQDPQTLFLLGMLRLRIESIGGSLRSGEIPIQRSKVKAFDQVLNDAYSILPKARE